MSVRLWRTCRQHSDSEVPGTKDELVCGAISLTAGFFQGWRQDVSVTGRCGSWPHPPQQASACEFYCGANDSWRIRETDPSLAFRHALFSLPLDRFQRSSIKCAKKKKWHSSQMARVQALLRYLYVFSSGLPRPRHKLHLMSRCTVYDGGGEV